MFLNNANKTFSFNLNFCCGAVPHSNIITCEIFNTAQSPLQSRFGRGLTLVVSLPVTRGKDLRVC